MIDKIKHQLLIFINKTTAVVVGGYEVIAVKQITEQINNLNPLYTPLELLANNRKREQRDLSQIKYDIIAALNASSPKQLQVGEKLILISHLDSRHLGKFKFACKQLNAAKLGVLYYNFQVQSIGCCDHKVVAQIIQI